MSDKDVIQANGTDVATLKVMFGDQDVTAESVFYDEDDNLLALDGAKFTATEVGEYKIYADYGTMSTFNNALEDKGLFVIKAINLPVPVAPADPQPANTAFVHRAFLIFAS